MQPFLHQKCLSWFKVQRSRETLLVLDQVLPRCRGWDVMSRRKTGKNSRDICIELDGCRASKLRRETYSRARWWGSACGKIRLVIQHRNKTYVCIEAGTAFAVINPFVRLIRQRHLLLRQHREHRLWQSGLQWQSSTHPRLC